MSDEKCNHHWHVIWLDKHSEAIQCCHCGDSHDECGFRYVKPNKCGDKASSRPTAIFPVTDLVLLVNCTTCEGGGGTESTPGDPDSWSTCTECDGDGYTDASPGGDAR